MLHFLELDLFPPFHLVPQVPRKGNGVLITNLVEIGEPVRFHHLRNLDPFSKIESENGRKVTFNPLAKCFIVIFLNELLHFIPKIIFLV